MCLKIIDHVLRRYITSNARAVIIISLAAIAFNLAAFSIIFFFGWVYSISGSFAFMQLMRWVFWLLPTIGPAGFAMYVFSSCDFTKQMSQAGRLFVTVLAGVFALGLSFFTWLSIWSYLLKEID